MRSFIIASLLALASCQRHPQADPCGGVIDCLSSRHGIVLGDAPSGRMAAKRELQSAADSYSAWFNGRTPPSGLVILDAGAARNAGFVEATDWMLTFDRSMEGGQLPAPLKSVPFEVSRESGEFDVTRPGILAHEICHKYASRVFEQVWKGTRVLPDMLDEVAAISCESEDLKGQRVGQFVQQLAKGAAIPWQDFLATNHPFKDGEAMKTLSQLARAGRGAVTFDIRQGSPYEAKIGIFYSQAAAFEAFVKARSCKGVVVLGALLSTYDPRDGLDQWLRSKGAQFCLPSSVDSFEKSFSQYIAHWKMKQSH